MILSSASAAQVTTIAAWALGLPSLVALAGYALAAALREQAGAVLRAALFVGWIAHAVAIVSDIAGVGSESVIARFGFAPALSMTIWLVLAVYLVESRFVPLPGARRVLAVLGMVVVVVAWMFPGEFTPQVPSRWAPVHWALGIASYGLFGAAVLHAAMLGRAERQMRAAATVTQRGMPLLQLERMTFRFVGAGFVGAEVAATARALGVEVTMFGGMAGVSACANATPCEVRTANKNPAIVMIFFMVFFARIDAFLCGYDV